MSGQTVNAPTDKDMENAKKIASGDEAKKAAMEWGGGLFGCFKSLNVMHILMAWCVPCVLQGQVAEKSGVGSCALVAVGLCCFDVCAIGSAYVRGKAEEQSGASNSGLLLNMCIHCWCHCCAVMQEARAVGVGAPEEMTMSR